MIIRKRIFVLTPTKVRGFIWFFAIAIFGCVFFLKFARAENSAAPSNLQASSAADLQVQLQEKSKELDVINQQLDAAKKNLNSTVQERTTLQQQVKTIQANIDTLNLGIKADTIAVQRLQIQIQQLGSNLHDISASIDLKQKAVQNTLRELRKNDLTNENLFTVFLKNGTLADGVLEAQTIHNLQNQLASDIDNLKTLHDQYDNTIKESSVKKDIIAAQQNDLQNKALIANDQKAEQQNLLKVTQGKESLFQQQYTALQKEQQQIAGEIELIDAALRAKINPSALPAQVRGVLAVPVPSDTENEIMQGYGATAFAKRNYAGHWHNGLDFRASIGTPIVAAESGVVVASGNQDLYCRHGAYGKFIVINHNNNLTTLYGHFSRMLVEKGDTVTRGQVIGYAGQTGFATGPHLHFTVYAQATFYMGPSKVCGPMPYGGDLDPTKYLF